MTNAQERDTYAGRIVEQDAEYYLMDERLEELKEQLAASEQRVRELERMMKFTDEIDESVMEKQQQQLAASDIRIKALERDLDAVGHDYEGVKHANNQLQSTVRAQQEEIGRLKESLGRAIFIACTIRNQTCMIGEHLAQTEMSIARISALNPSQQAIASGKED